MSETITRVFPVTIRVQPGYQHGFDSKTVVEPLADGTSQRRGLWKTDGFLGASLTTEYLTGSQLQTVRDFLKACRGELVPFYLFVLDPNELYVAEAIGTTAGTTAPEDLSTIFYNPVVSAVYIDGVTVGTDFSVTNNVGTYGEAKITLTAAHAAAKPVTADLTGRKRFGVRLTQDGFRYGPAPKTGGSRYVVSFSVQEV